MKIRTGRLGHTLFVTFLLFGLGLTVTAFGQPGSPGGDPDAVPITGIEWLLIGGGLFGARSVYRKLRNKF